LLPFVLSRRSQARTDETNIQSSPTIAVVVAERDTPEAWVEAGRVYERFALQATALDIRTTRRLDDPALRTCLVQAIGLRFRTVGWIALGLLLTTGLVNLWYRPYLLGVPRFHCEAGARRRRARAERRA
jgi:hypothetical protein